MGKLAQAAGVGAIGGAIPGGAGAGLKNKVAAGVVGAVADGGTNAALTAGSAVVGGERDVKKIVRDSLQAGATGAVSHGLGVAAHGGLQRASVVPRHPTAPAAKTHAVAAGQAHGTRTTQVGGHPALARNHLATGHGTAQPQRARAGAATETAGAIPPGGGGGRTKVAGGSLPERPGGWNGPKKGKGPKPGAGPTPGKEPASAGVPGQANTTPSSQRRIVQQNPDGTFRLYSPNGNLLQTPPSQPASGATTGPVGAVPPGQLPPQVPPANGTAQPAPAGPVAQPSAITPANPQPGAITPTPSEPRAIQFMDSLAKKVDVRVQGSASLPLGPFKPLAGSLNVGVRSITYAWKNRTDIKDVAMTVLRGGGLPQESRDKLSKFVAGAVGINVPAIGLKGGGRDATLGGDAKLPLGATDTMRLRVPTLQASAHDGMVGRTSHGVGVDMHNAEYSYTRLVNPEAGPDPVVGYVTAKAPLRLNVDRAELPPGQRDAFGSASQEHYRLASDLKIDDLTIGVSGGPGFIEHEYPTSGADVVIPAGSYLPREFVDNLRARLNGATAEMTVPVRQSERERNISLAGQFKQAAQQPGRAPEPGKVKVDSPSIRRFSSTGVDYGDQSKRIHVNFSATEQVLFMPLQALNSGMKMLSGGRLGLPEAVTAPKTIPGVWSPVDALVSKHDFRKQAEQLVSAGVSTFKLSNYAGALPEPLRTLATRILPSGQVQIQATFPGSSDPKYASSGVKRNETSVVGLGRNGGLVSDDKRAHDRTAPAGPSMDVPSWTVRPLTVEVSQVPVGGKQQLETWLNGLDLPPGSAKAQAVERFREAVLPKLSDTKAILGPERDGMRALIQELLRPDAPPALPPQQPRA